MASKNRNRHPGVQRGPGAQAFYDLYNKATSPRSKDQDRSRRVQDLGPGSPGWGRALAACNEQLAAIPGEGTWQISINYLRRGKVVVRKEAPRARTGPAALASTRSTRGRSWRVHRVGTRWGIRQRRVLARGHRRPVPGEPEWPPWTAATRRDAHRDQVKRYATSARCSSSAGRGSARSMRWTARRTCSTEPLPQLGFWRDGPETLDRLATRWARSSGTPPG
jgi:hypothetical protein